MQIMIGKDAVIYDMSGNDVAIIHSMDEFLNPFDFTHTGFVCKISEHSYETNF